MELHKEKFDKAGIQVIVVAMGEPRHITRYCDRLAPSLVCLTGDEGGEAAYRAYGLRDGNWNELASLEVFKGGIRAFQKGAVGGVPMGNVKMMPGSFIIDTEGQIIHTHYNQHIADHPDIERLIQAVRTQH